MKTEGVPIIKPPESDKAAGDEIWFLNNRENPEIADKIERRADVYIRRIKRAMDAAAEYRAKKAKNPDYWEFGASENIDLDWYNDLAAAAEDPLSAERMAEVEALVGWTQQDFMLLIEAINAASPEIRSLLENRPNKQNKYKPGYEDAEAKKVKEDPIESIERILNGARRMDTAILEQALNDLEDDGRAIPPALAKKVFQWQLERMIDGVPGTRESDSSWRILQKLQSR